MVHKHWTINLLKHFLTYANFIIVVDILDTYVNRYIELMPGCMRMYRTAIISNKNKVLGPIWVVQNSQQVCLSVKCLIILFIFFFLPWRRCSWLVLAGLLMHLKFIFWKRLTNNNVRVTVNRVTGLKQITLFI